jgi:hypothetical protein
MSFKNVFVSTFPIVSPNRQIDNGAGGEGSVKKRVGNHFQAEIVHNCQTISEIESRPPSLHGGTRCARPTLRLPASRIHSPAVLLQRRNSTTATAALLSENQREGDFLRDGAGVALDVNFRFVAATDAGNVCGTHRHRLPGTNALPVG